MSVPRNAQGRWPVVEEDYNSGNVEYKAEAVDDGGGHRRLMLEFTGRCDFLRRSSGKIDRTERYKYQ